MAIATRAGAAAPNALAVDVGERLVVVAPHPDDETLGAGGLIRRVLARAGSARVILVTAGDGDVEAVAHDVRTPRPQPAEYRAYGARRLAETRAALRVFGDGIRLQVLGYPDGGLEDLLRAHWRRARAERSPTTGARHPPYPDAVEHDVAYDGADLVRELERLLAEAAPTLIALPDPLDRHPDHRATALFTLLALRRWAEQPRPPTARPPRAIAYLVHWPGWPPGWDGGPSADRRAPLALPPNLPRRGLVRAALVLSAAEVAAKNAALARYASQQEIVAPFLAAFARGTEPFSILTASTLEHAGKLATRPPRSPHRASSAAGR